MSSHLIRLSGILILAMAFAIAPQIAEAKGDPCRKDGDAVVPAGGGGTGKDLLVEVACTVPEGTYVYRNVNIIEGGTLVFADGKTQFSARSILIENGGTLAAGYDVSDPKNPQRGTPIGTKPGAALTIYLYGMEDQDSFNGVGIPCVMMNCGIPDKIWCSQPVDPMDPHDTHSGCKGETQGGDGKVRMSNGITDWFYRYHPLPYDGGLTDGMPGYFGYKVIGVSYGGSLLLLGKNGVTQDSADPINNADPDVIKQSLSGTSWRRLALTARGGDTTITLDKKVDWRKNDWIVVTTTDYLPGHSEMRQIAGDPVITGNRTVIKLATPLKYTHNGSEFDVSPDGPNNVPTRLGLPNPKMENRAAVALLTRSIQIVSAGAEPTSKLPDDSFFGGHTVIRQGAQKLQIQGVEFQKMGQGGRIAHYPVHFHAARKMPKDTFVKDTSVNESMTRWYTIHGTHNVTLARNVGWKSIGHGYYLEEGTEIDNNLLSNIGIYARAALKKSDYPDNDRNVPGILAAKMVEVPRKPGIKQTENVPFYSDYDHPAVFWVMNAYNRFEDNMAVGAAACGICYWMLPGSVSGHSRDQQWEGYAAIQMGSKDSATDRSGLTPVKSFTGNFCSTAAMSFNTVANTFACLGVGEPDVAGYISIPPVENKLAPASCDQSNPLWDVSWGTYPSPPKPDDPPYNQKYAPWACNQAINAASLAYYPQVGGGGRFPTLCDGTKENCATVKRCGEGTTDDPNNVDNCAVTVIDRYTTSFHWAEQNFAALWLRPHWYLVSNSFITDVVNSGLTFVTGGGYTQSDAPYGHWALAYRTTFIGETQDPKAPGNAATPFTSNLSPFNNLSMGGAVGLACATGAGEGNRCVNYAEGVSFQRSNFGVNQRLFNIYDGPAYQSSNAYINIKKATIDCKPSTTPNGTSECASKPFLVAKSTGLPYDIKNKVCYMPNAAIGWKQPNGFYYPPAFHSDNLYFHNVDIRHFVTQPLFEPASAATNFLNTYQTSTATDATGVWANYCNFTTDMFNNFTDIDRQTELNDDDGSLTGYANTISVNKDPFFTAPVEGLECETEETAKTSPYDYITSVVYPECGVTKTCGTVEVTDPPVPPSTTPIKGAFAAWNQDCGNETCAGVPMYRQLELKTNLGGPRHAIQMAGQATYQRSTLAVNNGHYYIDTTISAEAQRNMKPKRTLLNVFQPGQTYYSFMLYAKVTPSSPPGKYGLPTRQYYKVYVGKTPNGDPKGFDETTDFWPVRVAIRSNPPVFTKATAWPAGWGKHYDKDTGILEVWMDMTDNPDKDGKQPFFKEYTDGLADACQPSSFCKVDGAGVCGCAINPITKKPDPGCSANVCKWAGRDTACPEGGCWGFAFKLAGNFDTLPKPTTPPDLDCFTDDRDDGWNVEWEAPDRSIESKGNSCYKPPVNKKPVFCKKPA